MSVSESIANLTRTVAEVYRELATASVRFDALQAATETAVSRFERLIELYAQRVQVLHDEHVREKAALEAQSQAREGRLNALSEKALHAVVQEAAREMVRGSVGALDG